MKITYLTYSLGEKKITKHFILPPSLVNAYLLHYYNQQVTKLLTPQASTQLLLIKHKHTCSSLSRTNQHICTPHEHGHGLNIINPTTVLTLGCICDLCCVLSPLFCPTL